MDSPSFKGFHAQLDCRCTYGYKNQTQQKSVFENKTEKKQE